MNDPKIQSEMAIPKPMSEIIGAVIFAAFILFFVVLAVLSIIDRVAMVASGIWLILVIIVIWVGYREAGSARKYFVDFLGAFAPRHFVDCVRGETPSAEIRFGYKLLGQRFFFLKLPVEKIETVEWSTGQATSIAGRDMNDWHVSVWFDRDVPLSSEERQFRRKPDCDIYIVGPSGEKEITTDFAHSFINFLAQAGASLERGEDEFTYVRKAKEKQK